MHTDKNKKPSTPENIGLGAWKYPIVQINQFGGCKF